MEAHHKFRGEMLGVRRASTIAEKDQFASRCKRLCGAHSKRLDASQQFIGETLFYSAAFTELGADLFNMRAHNVLHQDDFIAVAGDSARGVS